MMATSGGGGYDYQFVHGTPQEFLICKICLAASRDPHLSVCCGHIFCKSCIDFTIETAYNFEVYLIVTIKLDE